MKTKILVGLLLAGILVACSKDKFETVPTLTLNSVGDKVVPRNGGLKLVFEVTDNEGDVSNYLLIKKTRRNRRPVNPNDDLGRDSLVYQVPPAPDTRKVFLDVNLNYDQLISVSRAEPDTLLFQFQITDKEGNKSNIVDVDNVVILK